MKILFEKFSGNNLLHSWTMLFNNIDEVLKFMEQKKDYLLGDNLSPDYTIKIRGIKEF